MQVPDHVGVAYEAAKSYEDHVAQNGKPDSHEKAKEILYALIAVCMSHHDLSNSL